MTKVRSRTSFRLTEPWSTRWLSFLRCICHPKIPMMIMLWFVTTFWFHYSGKKTFRMFIFMYGSFSFCWSKTADILRELKLLEPNFPPQFLIDSKCGYNGFTSSLKKEAQHILQSFMQSEKEPSIPDDYARDRSLFHPVAIAIDSITVLSIRCFHSSDVGGWRQYQHSFSLQSGGSHRWSHLLHLSGIQFGFQRFSSFRNLLLSEQRSVQTLSVL